MTAHFPGLVQAHTALTQYMTAHFLGFLVKWQWSNNRHIVKYVHACLEKIRPQIIKNRCEKFRCK
jgi:hypothetical protein